MNVSVIIPVYKAEKLVRKAVESALFHTEVKEVILVEDASPDNSLEVCKTLVTEYERVVLYQHKDGKNKGAGASRNLGILKATQDYISFLDADDYFSENRFKNEKDVFNANANADGVYGATGVHYIDDFGAKVWEERGQNEHSLTTVNRQISPKQLFESLIWFNNINYGYFHLDAFTLKRNRLLSTNILFDESLRLHQDTVFIRQCAYYLNLFTGEYQKPIASRGVHKENRFIHHKNIKDSRSKQYKSLIKWSKEANLEEKYLAVFKQRYYNLNPKYFGIENKFNILKKNLKLIFLKNYLSGRFREKDVILISSSPRSGSTMLSNALKAIPKSYVLFEPLNLIHVPEAKSAGFSWRTYIPQESEWKKGKNYLTRVIEGKVITYWTSKEMRLRESLYVNTLIVKFVRANRILPWIYNNFNTKKPILLLRHPCAVVASQLKSSDWNKVKRPDTPTFLKDFPLFESVLLKTKTTEENLAAQWALDQLPVLINANSSEIIIITYEELLLYPEKTISKVFKTWKLDVDIDNAVSRLKKPSSVVYKSGMSGIDGWRKQLSEKQIENILTIVNGFGINFYTVNTEPNYNILYNDNLRSQIRKANNFK